MRGCRLASTSARGRVYWFNAATGTSTYGFDLTGYSASGDQGLVREEFAKKGSAPVYNLLPDIMSSLSADAAVDAAAFEHVMGFLIGFIQKDRQTESTVEKLSRSDSFPSPAASSDGPIISLEWLGENVLAAAASLSA